MIADLQNSGDQDACTNHLKQIGLAFKKYFEDKKRLPDLAISQSEGKPLLSWRVALLPYLGEQERALHAQFKLDQPWNSPSNRALVAKMPPVYGCPGAEGQPGYTGYLAILNAPNSVYRTTTGQTAAQRQKNYQGGGVLVVDVADKYAVPWTRPVDFDYAAHDGETLAPVLIGHHDEGYQQLLANGRVEFQANPDAGRKLAGAEPPPELLGTWRVTNAFQDGRQQSTYTGMLYTLEPTALLTQPAAGKPKTGHNYRLNTTKAPPWIDWLPKNTKDNWQGIYELKGDTLRLCFGSPDKPRPIDFNTRTASMLLTLQRVSTAPNSTPAATADASKGDPKRETWVRDNLDDATKKAFDSKENLRWLVHGYDHDKHLTAVELEPKPNKVGHRRVILVFSFRDVNRPKLVASYGLRDDEFALLNSEQNSLDKFPPTRPRIDPTGGVTPEAMAAIARFTGTWKVDSAINGGRPSKALKGRMISFAEGRVALNVQTLERIEYPFKLEVDPARKPAQYTIFNGERVIQHGIFIFEDDSLKLCFTRSNVPRPTDFTARKPGEQMHVLKKVKPDTKKK